MAELGYNTIPGTGNSLPSNALFGTGVYTMTEDGTPVSMSAYITFSAGTNVRLAIYTDVAGAPTDFVDITDQITTGATGWHTANVQHATPLTNGTGYWLAIWVETPGLNIPTDAGGSSNFQTFTYVSTGDSEDPWSGGSGGGNKIGIYVTYTPASAGAESAVYQSDRLKKVQRAIY